MNSIDIYFMNCTISIIGEAFNESAKIKKRTRDKKTADKNDD